ncbi:MAG: hypothetical protein LBD31_04860, partial [Treponema sp.]|nr:hypothetical protein [Treponema sp.]
MNRSQHTHRPGPAARPGATAYRDPAALFVLLVLALPLLAACGGPKKPARGEGISVVATIFPPWD